MARRIAALLAVLGMAGAATPWAKAGDLEFFTGQGLYAECSAKPATADDLARLGRCSGYVMGVSDAQQALQGAGGAQRVCLPATATETKIVAVVARYLAEHPEKRPMAAQDLVLEALGAAYACP